MTANFEEKTYEQYFNNELDRRSKMFFPPGQVLEGLLGFDASSFSTNRRLWRRLGYPFWFTLPFSGAELRDVADLLEDEMGHVINGLPKMKCNLLFQYKRPEYITRQDGKEWSHWKTAYYRYDIYREQQDLLERLDSHFASRVLILYASPAVHDVNELFTIKQSGKIIETSNFRKAVELNGHDRNTYINAGTYSIACSEPKRIDNFDLIELISNLQVDSNSNESNVNFINNFRKQLTGIMSESTYISDTFLKSIAEFEYLSRFPLLYSFLVLGTFRLLTGCQWLIAFNDNSEL